MRPLVQTAIVVLCLLPAAAEAAQPSWLQDLLGPARPVHHRAAKPAAKPVAAPVTPRPAPAGAARTVAAGRTLAAWAAPAVKAFAAGVPASVAVATAATVAGSSGIPATAEAAKPAMNAAPASPVTTPAPPQSATADSRATPAAETTADADGAVPVPRPRPAVVAAAQAETAPVPMPGVASPAPQSFPAGGVPATPPDGAGSASPAEGESATAAPPRVYQTACPAVITGLVEAKPLPPIADGQCQEQSPLSVTGILVNGRMLPLSAPATFGCGMATDLPGWVADVDTYIYATQKTRIKTVLVGESYVCRPRNVPGGNSPDLSEHGRADALDFVGFTLEDGRQLTVTADYGSSDATLSRLMHFAHDAACTRFTTVLGPEANALHHDHFHLDLGCHGKTCTYRLCE